MKRLPAPRERRTPRPRAGAPGVPVHPLKARARRWKDSLFPLAGTWQCTSTSGRIVWTEPLPKRSADWSSLLVAVALALGVLLAVLAAMAVLALPVVGLAVLVKGTPPSGADEFADMLAVALAACVAMVAVSTVAGSVAPAVFRAEFDLPAQQLRLHETRFPNRRRIVTIAFADIVMIRPRQFSQGGALDVELQASHDGASVNKRIGQDLDEATINAHLDLLRCCLGERVQDLIVHDT